MHKYLPHTEADIKAMLETIGAKSVDELFQAIPKTLQYNKTYNILPMLSDHALTKHMQELANMNQQLTIFRGAGAYDHYTPSIVKSLISRQEFLTAYTPYQPEVAQGTLQYIFEYQSMVCELTGMDVSNASMYDGATATAEAMFMAVEHTKRKRILLADTVSEAIQEVVKTYADYRGIDVIMIASENGHTVLDCSEHCENAAGLIVQSPNRYGIIEDVSHIAKNIHDYKGLLIMNSDPSTLALLKSPREYDADIAVGDLQTMGLPLHFGGAYIGYLATKESLMRKMPGRICGITDDVDGKRAFVLTLQAREQHIRRAKANSNICSNQSLMALAVTIYMATMGKQGIKEVARQSMSKAHYLHDELLKTKKFSQVFDQPFFKEFVLKTHIDPQVLEAALLKENILGPLHLKDDLVMFAVTEKRSKEEMDHLIKVVSSL